MMGKVGMNSKLLLFVIAGLIVSSYYVNDIFAEEQNSVGEIQWLEASYPSTGTSVVRVIDPDMNLNPKEVDYFDVDVWSDTDIAGIDLTMTETGASTGIFEGTVFFSTTDNSSGHRLRVGNGDTIYSKYEDNSLPDSHTKNQLDVIHTASIQGTPNSIIDDRVSLDKKSYSWTDKVYVTIIAPEYNLDSDSIEKIDASEQYRVTVTTRHFEIDDYQLVETGADTGIFTGKIVLNENEFYDINSNGDDGISVFFEYVDNKEAIGSAPIIWNSFETVDDAPFFGIFVYLDELFSWIMENFGNKQAETVDMSSKELKSSGNGMSFSDFADNFSTCSSATFKHTMITNNDYPIYVIANITDDCKIHVIHDNREDKNTDVAHRKLIEAECDKLILEDDYIDFENCIISENESGSFRVWK